MGEEGTVGTLEALPPIVLREVRWDDLALLVEHRNQWDTRRWLEDCNTITLEQQRRWFDTASCRFRIATVDGEQIGLARLTTSHDDSAEVGCDVFLKYRGKGYGKAIFAALMTRIVDLGARRAELWVFLENAAALRLYEHAGFHLDLSVPVKTFLRPDEPLSTPRSRLYAKMVKRLA